MFALMVAAAVSAEAGRLGREVAAGGALETLMPAIAARETEEFISAHSDLSEADRILLRRAGRDVAERSRTKLIDAFGRAYASQLSLPDLRAIAAFNRTAASKHYRAAMPAATFGALAAIGNLDFKADLQREFCARTGRLCEKR
jgi:hypothetical protein